MSSVLPPRTLWRGNPPSADHQPDPVEIVRWAEWVEESLKAGVNRLENADLATVGTNITLSGEQTIDGTLTSSSRVLVKNQTNPVQNGIYVSSSGAWSRAADADTTEEIANAFIFVSGGAANAGNAYSISGSPVLGVDPVLVTQIAVQGITVDAIRPLTSVAGTGAAYTALADDGTLADDPEALVIFTPNVTNTIGSPTLSVNGGPAFPIGESGPDALGVNRLIAGYPYILRRTGGAWRLITDKWLKDKIAAEESARKTAVSVAEDSARHQARWAAIANSMWMNSLTEGGRDDDAIFLINGVDGAEYWVASNHDHPQTITVSNDQFVDVRHMKAGSANPVTIMTYPGSSATIIRDDGNDLIGADAFVQIFRDAIGSYHYNAVSGVVTEDGGAATPACDHTLITGGQSLARRLLDGAGQHGFQQGWRDYAGTDETKFWFAQGAVGGSGLVPASNASNYWWDPVSNTDGPNLTAWKAAVDAIPAGQPEVSAIIWIFGQTDAGAIGTDPTLTLSAYKATLKRVLEEMQDYVNPTTPPPVIICPVGAWDPAFDTGVQSVRWVEQELIAENASFHQGPAYFDLPRPWDDVHHATGGQKLLGYRLAAVLDNVLNSAGHETGPEVIGIEELESGKKYRLTIEQHTSNDFTRPLAPEGFVVYQSGANPLLNSAINIVGYEWAAVGGGVWTLTIELGLSFPGATILFPSGACTWARRGRWPMNTRNDPNAQGYGNLWPLKPFKSGAF